ncbi:hypothetical protein PsYK624_156090 [Phanerochaete sordida]|uniref:Uncharacterized protein n=1 Tax=Phanerochaete sordida TaxID=48140 RepID=A0A9P3LLF8_9APHY|nr:hypothetical protein PsYK624_156090 [Phanerochaete sordida]
MSRQTHSPRAPSLPIARAQSPRRAQRTRPLHDVDRDSIESASGFDDPPKSPQLNLPSAATTYTYEGPTTAELNKILGAAAVTDVARSKPSTQKKPETSGKKRKEMHRLLEVPESSDAGPSGSNAPRPARGDDNSQATRAEAGRSYQSTDSSVLLASLHDAAENRSIQTPPSGCPSHNPQSPPAAAIVQVPTHQLSRDPSSDSGLESPPEGTLPPRLRRDVYRDFVSAPTPAADSGRGSTEAEGGGDSPKDQPIATPVATQEENGEDSLRTSPPEYFDVQGYLAPGLRLAQEPIEVPRAPAPPPPQPIDPERLARHDAAVALMDADVARMLVALRAALDACPNLRVPDHRARHHLRALWRASDSAWERIARLPPGEIPAPSPESWESSAASSRDRRHPRPAGARGGEDGGGRGGREASPAADEEERRSQASAGSSQRGKRRREPEDGEDGESTGSGGKRPRSESPEVPLSKSKPKVDRKGKGRAYD